MRFTRLAKKLGATSIAALSLLLAKPAKAQQYFVYGNLAYITNADNVSLSVYLFSQDAEPGGDVVIPSSVYGLPVTQIAPEAFALRDYGITSITIPNTVTTIGHDAFDENPTLQSVTIPSSVTSIGSSAFYECTSLQNIYIPDSVTSMANGEVGMFEDCWSLQSARLPNSMTTIGDSMFFNCASLTSVNIPNSVTTIGEMAFQYCKFSTLKIPDSVVDIQRQAFYGNLNLTSLTVGSGVTSIDGDAFSECTKLSKVCFLGDEPYANSSNFLSDPVQYIYYIIGKEWGPSYSGLPTQACTQCVGQITDPPNPGNLYPPLPIPCTPAKNLALVIPGWSPTAATSSSEEGALPVLYSELKNSIGSSPDAANWDVLYYNWSGPATYTSSTGLRPVQAVRNAVHIGQLLGAQLSSPDSKYTNIIMFAHSTGPWIATGIGTAAASTDINADAIFMDAFVPANFGFLNHLFGGGANYPASALGVGLGKVEHYYHGEHDYLPIIHLTPFGTGLGVVLPNAVNYDVANMETCPQVGDFRGTLPDWHAWPIKWYIETIQNSPDWCGADGDGYWHMFAGAGVSPLACDCSSGYPQPAAVLAAPASQGVPTPPGGLQGAPADTNGPPLPSPYVQPIPQLVFLGSDIPLLSLAEFAQGGTGAITNGAGDVDFSTTNLVWETFAFTATNDITLGTVSYSLPAPGASTLELYLDGALIQAIPNFTNDPADTEELFPIVPAIGMGNHNLTVALRTTNGLPVAANVSSAGFYYCVSQPAFSSQTVDTNGNFDLSWEAGAGLNYQLQYAADPSSSNWSNLFGVMTSPTNAIMQAFDAIQTNQQRFYRIVLQQ